MNEMQMQFMSGKQTIDAIYRCWKSMKWQEKIVLDNDARKGVVKELFMLMI